MRRRVTAHQYALAICGVVLALAGCGGGGRIVIVALVGREVITRSALEHWVAVERNATGGAVSQRNVLRTLIELHWISAQAAEYGLSVGHSEAHKQLEILTYARRSGARLNLFEDEAQLQRLLQSPKLTVTDRTWLVIVQMLALRMHQHLVRQAERTLSQQRVAAFYREHLRSFIAPETRDMEIFMTNDRATAARAKREVEAGKSFQSVAKRFNVSPEAHGGLIMGLARGAGEPQFEKHVFYAKPHVLLGPVTQVLTYVYRVTKVLPQHPRGLIEVQSLIRHTLAVQDASGTLAHALRQRWRTRTACQPGYVVTSCREYARP
jgi:PPIC-type PPIASE domain